MFDDKATETNHKLRLAEVMAKRIAAAGLSRAEIERQNKPGEVWSREELEREFEILFEGLRPILVVRRLSDSARGLVMSQDEPEFYFGWQLAKKGSSP